MAAVHSFSIVSYMLWPLFTSRSRSYNSACLCFNCHTKNFRAQMFWNFLVKFYWTHLNIFAGVCRRLCWVQAEDCRPGSPISGHNLSSLWWLLWCWVSFQGNDSTAMPSDNVILLLKRAHIFFITSATTIDDVTSKERHLNPLEYLTMRGPLLIEQCPGPSSQCDHTSWFLRLELQRAGDSPQSKWTFSWGGTRTTDQRINGEPKSYPWAILTPDCLLTAEICYVNRLVMLFRLLQPSIIFYSMCS